MFLRSSRPFFSSEEAKAILSRAAEAKHLVIYCGAGVTIDRTGMGWESMLAKAFRQDAQLVARMRTDFGFPQIATALATVDSEDPGVRAADWEQIAARLSAYLYPDEGEQWQIGEMVPSLTTLAVAAAASGKSVTVVTTNFDDYLERSLTAAVSSFAGETPLIAVSSEANDLEPPRLVGGGVEFFYIHGRIPSDGSPASTHRVLDEIDYATSRGRTVDFLRTAFSVPDSVLIILGSSLTDPPLIDSLALTRSASNSRVALYALEPTRLFTEELCDEIVTRLRSRSKILGFELLVPDFLYQIPQFLTELSQAILDPAGPAAYVVSDSRYGARLARWWSGFNARWDPDSLHQAVRTTYSAILPYLPLSDAEILRLDLWVREEPERRQLSLVASTIGPLTDSSLLKREELRLGSRHATLNAFIQGRPRYVGLHELDWPDGFGGRWKSFLVVPLQEQVDDILTPIGAATVSSSLPPEQSAIGRLTLEDRNRVLALIRAMLELPTQAD